MELTELYTVAMIALAISAISITITLARVFERPRIWLHKRNKWLGKLMSCPYCFSHWVSILLISIYQPTPVQLWFPLDLVLSMLITVAIASIISGIIIKLIPFSSEFEDELTALTESLEDAKIVIERK